MKTRTKFARVVLMLTAAIVMLSACSGSGSPTTTGAGDPSVTTQAPDTTQGPPSGNESDGSTDDTGESSPNTNMALLVVIGIILAVALIAWLASRNSSSDGASQSGGTNENVPAPPLPPQPTTHDDNQTADTDAGPDAAGTGSQEPPSA